MNKNKKITDRRKFLEKEMKKNLLRRKNQIKKSKIYRRGKKNGFDVWSMDRKSSKRK